MGCLLWVATTLLLAAAASYGVVVLVAASSCSDACPSDPQIHFAQALFFGAGALCFAVVMLGLLQVVRAHR